MGATSKGWGKAANVFVLVTPGASLHPGTRRGWYVCEDLLIKINLTTLYTPTAPCSIPYSGYLSCGTTIWGL